MQTVDVFKKTITVIIKRFALIFLTLVSCKTDLKKVQFRNDK